MKNQSKLYNLFYQAEMLKKWKPQTKCESQEEVFSNPDLLKLIFKSNVNPHTLGRMAQVCKEWRKLAGSDDDILRAAAKCREVLNAELFAGLFWLPVSIRKQITKQFALSKNFRNGLPHEAIDHAMLLGGAKGVLKRRIQHPKLRFKRYRRRFGVPGWFIDDRQAESTPPHTHVIHVQNSPY